MRRWRKSLAVAAIAALLVAGPLLLTLRAGEVEVQTIVYFEAQPDDDRSRLVLEPVWSADGDPSDERTVYTVTHETGFMPRGVLERGGRWVALVRQPRGRPERELAEALTVDLDHEGAQAVLVDPVFGLLTPVFSTTAGPLRAYVTSAAVAPRPPPSDEEMQAGRLRPYDFTIWEVEVDRDDRQGIELAEQRLTWLEPAGIGLVRFGPQSSPAPGLVLYRVTHAGADIAAVNLLTREDPVNLVNLGFAMARDFDVSEDGTALLFLAVDPGQTTGRIYSLYMAQGGAPNQLGGDVPREASPAWARSYREWFLSRRPPRVGLEASPPLRLHRANEFAPNGRSLDSLTSLTGVAQGHEVPLAHGVSRTGRWVAARTDPGTGPIFFLRDTVTNQARTLGDGGLVRVLGYR